MWGYRLLRDGDYERLVDDLTAARTKIDALYAELIEAKAAARSKATLADAMTLRVNHVERERATLLQKQTGLPHAAPQISAGPPLMSEQMSAGVALFDDVGDSHADELRKQGLLHDDEPLVTPPTAAELSASAVPA